MSLPIESAVCYETNESDGESDQCMTTVSCLTDESVISQVDVTGHLAVKENNKTEKRENNSILTFLDTDGPSISKGAKIYL